MISFASSITSAIPLVLILLAVSLGCCRSSCNPLPGSKCSAQFVRYRALTPDKPANRSGRPSTSMDGKRVNQALPSKNTKPACQAI